MEREREVLRGPNPYLPLCTAEKSIYKAKTGEKILNSYNYVRNTKVNTEGGHRQVHSHHLEQREMEKGNR